MTPPGPWRNSYLNSPDSPPPPFQHLPYKVELPVGVRCYHSASEPNLGHPLVFERELIPNRWVHQLECNMSLYADDILKYCYFTRDLLNAPEVLCTPDSVITPESMWELVNSHCCCWSVPEICSPIHDGPSSLMPPFICTFVHMQHYPADGFKPYMVYQWTAGLELLFCAELDTRTMFAYYEPLNVGGIDAGGENLLSSFWCEAM